MSEENEIEIELEQELPETAEPEVVEETPAETPEEAHAKELESYSQRVQARINQLTKKQHDAERAQAAALKRAEELEAKYNATLAEKEEYARTLEWGRNVYLNEVNARLETAQKLAEHAYRTAYEAGDVDGIVKAQQAFQQVANERAKFSHLPPPVPEHEFRFTQTNNSPERIVESPVVEPQSEVLTESFNDDIRATDAPVVDWRAEQWQSRNPWFGKDIEMTSLAMGVHKKLVDSGIQAGSDAYYDAIDRRMGEVYPSLIKDAPRKSSPVAPAGRVSSGKKVALTKYQQDYAKRFNIPMERLAVEKQKLNQER